MVTEVEANVLIAPIAPISGNKDLFSSITTTSALPIVTIANGSQTVAKGIGLAHTLPSLPLSLFLFLKSYPFSLSPHLM